MSYSFVGMFLWNYGLGYFLCCCSSFFIACLLFTFRKEFLKHLRFRPHLFSNNLPILIVNMVLGAGLNLKAPYNNAIKYDYVALPFFCLIAGSLVGKCQVLFDLAKLKTNLIENWFAFAVIITSVISVCRNCNCRR